ncbi:PREDICTED: meiosis inhibitor protein 1 isoform X1 [Poecilia mexicana]|uniref:Meiosis inhibitor protein 1 n=1 Tax=Poecilia mexicana TaxID=48701 RepID=A0A3B3YV87_9TELE|nr:PREDICTED: meiosis inhibitor protein 1 isoform X1 [Poecilia mexicana]
MASTDIVYEQVHFRHDPKWSVRLRSAEGGGLLFCVACAIEMMETEEMPSVRKCFALSSISGFLKSSAEALRELFRQDHRVTLHFITTLLGMLQTQEDPVTVEKVDQVLVQLLLEFHNELPFHFVLDEVHKQLSGQLSGKRLLPTFSFLGNLVKTVPNVAHSFITQYGPLLDHLCSALAYPDEALKTSVVHVWLQLMQMSGDAGAQYLPIATRDRLCTLLLQTFSNASSAQLIKNCAGLLWQLVKYEEAVSVLMSSSGGPLMCDADEDVLTNNSPSLIQDQEQQPTDHSLLPLLLKKLLLSGDESLQVTSAKCIAAILVHSPSQYCALCIKADLPGFLFDRLASSSSEMLLWSIYSCLVLLTEEPLFFSQCHSVYGIESLVRSLKEALQLSNLEAPKQGFLLLTEILERQPPGVHLFPSASGFVAVSEAVKAGVSSSCLLVAAQAVKAATALFRLNHQSRPVQYQQLEELVEAISSRFPELILTSPSLRRSMGNKRSSDSSSQTFRSKGFLLQALICFQAACRLAEECASEPALMKNPFTAPYKHSGAQDSLESVCQCLLRCCDSVWIPAVLRTCDGPPSAQILESLYSILCSQFVLLPSLMPQFAKKLVSSGFYRLAVEHKALLCSGNRNPNLNPACCGFLQKLSMCLLFQSDPPCGSSHDFDEVETLLQCSLPALRCHLSDWPSLLCEYQEPRAVQYCLVMMLYLALKQGDRLLPDQAVFSSVVVLLQSVQEQGDCVLPRSVLRSALYLLAVTQDRSPSLDGAHLNYVSKALSSCQSFASLYSHHPALLHFIWRYPELAQKYGALVLELWLAKKSQTGARQDTQSDVNTESQTQQQKQNQEPDWETSELLALMEKHPNVMLTLLDMVVGGQAPVAEHVLHVLKVLLLGQREFATDLCTSLRPALLQALQRISVDNVANGPGQGHAAAAASSLPVVLKLLCLTQASDPPSPSIYSNMEGVCFKLLYHVSSVAGMLKPTDTESLLPAFNFLQCCLRLSPAHSSDRAVSVLLSNRGLMDQLQTVVSSSSTPSPPPPSCAPLALLCCSHLLLSSLITLQRVHSTQVHKSIIWSLDTAVHRLFCQKRNTDNLLLVSYLRMLQALLDADLASPVVCLSTGPGLVGPRPLAPEDGALYPLGSTGAQCLLITLSGLLMQKHELLLRTSVNCLNSLLGFLKRKNPDLAKQAVCQPWSQFLLYCNFSSGEKCLLHPALLRLITLLLQYGSTAVLWEPDLLHVIDTVERSGIKELNHEAARALRSLLAQVQSSVPLPAEDHKLRVRKLLESLGPQTSAESCSVSSVLNVGDVSLCMSEFSLKTP